MTFEEIRQIEDIDEREQALYKEFERIKNEASKRNLKILKGKYREFSEKLGMNYFTLYTAVNRGGFRLPVDQMVALANGELKISVHKLLYGYDIEQELTMELTVLAEILLANGKLKREIRSRVEYYYKNRGSQKTVKEVLGERLEYLAESKYVALNHLFGKDARDTVKCSLHKFLTIPTYTPTSLYFMYYSFLSDYSIDFFMCEDYIGKSYGYSIPVYLNGDRDRKIIQDEDVLIILSLYLRLSDEDKSRVAGEILYYYAIK